MADLPKFILSVIEKRRERLRVVFREVCGQPVTLTSFNRLVRRLQPRTGASRDTLTESLRHIIGQTLTDGDVLKLAWRLAANTDRLLAGEPVRQWTTQHADEWVPLQVTEVRPAKNRRGLSGYQLTCRVLAGTPCPMLLRVFWKPGLAGAISRRVGFTWSSGLYPYHRATEFTGLRFLGKIEAERSQREPQFFEVACPPSLISWNRKNVLTYRARQPGPLGCPQQFRHDCHRCAIGYLACPGGTHAHTFEVGECGTCGNKDAMFDTDLSSEVCRDCAVRAILKA